MSVQESADRAAEFLEGANVTQPCLLDSAGTRYHSYAIAAGDAPYPLEVLIDRAGVISYISREYDGPALSDAVRAALAAPPK